MDNLEFKILDKQNDGHHLKSVTILVNGQDLIDLLKVYELPFAKRQGAENIAGGYAGLLPETLLINLTNPDEYDIDENGKVSILDCECGCDGCWPMKTNIIELTDKIIWKNFEQPHRTIESQPFWDYSDFGQFIFDKNNYNEELNKLRRVIC